MDFSISSAKLITAFLLLVSAEVMAQGPCNLLDDPCRFSFDLQCDAGMFCAANTDCFDCDPFQQFRDQGCNACVANGGQYCEKVEGTPVCSSPEIASLVPDACSRFGGTLYTSTCTGTKPGPATERFTASAQSPAPSASAQPTGSAQPTSAPLSTAGDGSSGALAALSVLALIPIAWILLL